MARGNWGILSKHFNQIIANEGIIERPAWVRSLQFINRVWGYGRIKAITYPLSYLVANPLVAGLERVFLNSNQIEQIGTKLPLLQSGPILWGTVSLAAGSVFSMGWHAWWNFYFAWGLPGSGQNIIDGLLNTIDLRGSVKRKMEKLGLSLRDAVRVEDSGFFNKDPQTRPIQNSWFRNLVQRTVPLFFSLEGFTYLFHQKYSLFSFLNPFNRNADWNNTLNNLGVAATAAMVSSLVLHQVQKSPRLSEAGNNLGLMMDAGREVRKANYAFKPKRHRYHRIG